MPRPQRPAWRWAIFPPFILLSGCTSYEPAPLRPGEILRDLERVGLQDVTRGLPRPHGSFDPADGLTLVEAAAAAVQLNPRLTALRTEVAVSEAQLVEAGLLPDIVIGWEAGNNIADFITEGKSSANGYIAGASLEWPVPRPGEIDAKEGVARADIAGARGRVLAAEWGLVREVHEAYARLLVARSRVEQTQQLTSIAERSQEYLQRARSLGAATALDENLARIAAKTAQADVVRAQADELQARQALNGLLGLRPGYEWTPQTTLDQLLTPTALGTRDADALVRLALDRRPDLLETLAEYQRAEEALRLEIARQWPQISIGTGLSITLPIFSRFNQPAVRTAERARAATGRRLTVAVQQVRQEVHAALTEYLQAERLRQLFQDEVEPALVESLRLNEQAFNAREVTPLQILTSQQQVIETRARALEARERWVVARLRLQAATGDLLPELLTRFPTRDEDGEGESE